MALGALAHRVGAWRSRLPARPRRGARGRVAAAAAAAAPEAVAQKMALKVVKKADCDAEQLRALMQRPRLDFAAILERVEPIVNGVRDGGDAALRGFTKQFDRVELECAPST